MSRVIDVALLLVSGSKRHRGGNHASLFHPHLFKMATTGHYPSKIHELFFFREIMYLSQYRGSWVWFTPPQVAISSECAVKVSRLDAPYEPSLDRTFHRSFTILLDFLLHKHMHMMAFATFAGCPRCPARRAGTAVYFCVFILIPHTSLCLMPWMEFFCLFDLNRQSKSNKLGESWGCIDFLAFCAASF